MGIELLALNLDGTALQHGQRELSPRMRHILRVAARHGVQIISAAGRAYPTLPESMTQAIWSKYVIVLNGAETRDITNNGAILRSRYFCTEDAQSVIQFALQHHLPYSLTCENIDWAPDHFFANLSAVSVLSTYARNLRENGKTFEELTAFLSTHTVAKIILPYVPPEYYAKLCQFIDTLQLNHAWIGQNHVELTQPEANKGMALHALCEQLGIAREHVVAIGYSDADISLLQYAGIGVALGDAPATVQMAGDVVTDPSIEDGAAIAVETYVLAPILKSK